ncbi:MAG: 50S ribosomal protein L15 [Chloroflexi bacterium GWC2_73_18]|nr:MAG: 50S ribosomal protein L15 [Chloroflexi bacterium GWC2_73_18]
MKLHDLRPAPGSRRERTRVGRGIAAGKGKTAGRGTKGQKSRTGASIPAWFEGGQTPIHMRVPKLRGFKNRLRIPCTIINVGRIDRFAGLGRLAPAPAGAPVTVNAELLRAAGIIGTLKYPLKVLGGGEVTRPLFVVADAFSAAARAKIEAAGGTATVLEFPGETAAPAAIARDLAAPATVEPPVAVGEADPESAEAEPAPRARRRARKPVEPDAGD